MAKAKTREVVREVKEHSVDSIRDKATAAGIRTKDRAVEKVEESFKPMVNGQNGKTDGSAENYATETVTDTAQNSVETASEYGKRAVKSGVRKTKEKVQEKKAEKDAASEIENAELEEQPAETPVPEEPTVENENTVEKADKKEAPAKAEKDIKTKEKVEANKKTSETETQPVNRKAPKKKNTRAESGSPDIDGSPTEAKSIKKADEVEIRKKQRTPPKSGREIEPEAKSSSTPRKRERKPPKTRGKQDVKNVKPTDNKIKTLNGNAHKIKETKSSGANARRSIKTADNSFKTAEKNAKAAKKSAEATAKAAKKAEESAKVVAKNTAKAVKATAKAVVEGAKAAYAATKELVALIASGGTTALVVIIVTCLLAAIGGTCYGIFLSNDETTGTEMKMSEAISQLTSEYYADLTALKTKFTYDEMDVKSLSGDTNLNWKDILAIYAVKNTTAKNDGFEVVTLNEKKLDVLRGIMKDMNVITGVVTPKVVAETSVTYDSNGNAVKTTNYVTKKVLTITVTSLSADQICKVYKFDDEQEKQLKELMSDEYGDMWAEIIGASGDVIITNSSHTPKGMFTWPMQEDNYISSRFGTRADPITGVVKTHGGTDIAAAMGTPILAAADGTVVVASYDASGYGFYVKIQHDGTYATLYGHCSVLHVTAGQKVKQGQVIAEVGSTGHSTGPHCHFEVIQNGVRVDALQFFK